MNEYNDAIQPIITGELNTSIYQGIRNTLAEARSKAYSAVNSAMVEAYWEIGRQIDKAVGERAEYGKGLLQFLAQHLTEEFGKGFTERNLRAMRQFFAAFPIRHTLCAELSWSHYRLLMKIEDSSRREFYKQECVEATWSVRQLERQINSFFYERLLATQKSGAESVKNEIHTLEPKNDPDYILKDPYVLEFLDLKENRDYLESHLEQALINKLQEFLLELGKGFSFVARQKRITIEGDHYYVDLIFYNYILKCFVVIDLKAGKLTYQDVGQIDFYVRYFEDKVKHEVRFFKLLEGNYRNNRSCKKNVSEEGRIIIGGIASSILPNEIEKATGIKPYLNDRGGALLDRPGQIDPDSNAIIDELPLDCSILEEIDYVYPASNAYFSR